MKKLFFPIIAFAVLSFSIISCGNDAEAMLGTWKANSTKIESSTINANMLALIEGEYNSTKLEFSPENKVTMKRAGGGEKKGTYSIDDATNTLKIGLPADHPNHWAEEFTIKSQSGTEMTLVTKMDADGSTATLVLNKIK